MIALDLFAGAGGADLGLRRAGIDVVRAVEWDADACATLEAGGGHAVRGDVRHSDAYLGLPAIDLLWASPPCQDWSSAGKREGAAGERNGWPWTLDAIDFLRWTGRGPEWAVFENVAGMLHHTGGCRCPHGPPEECPAGYFHRWILPQLRERFAFVDYRLLDAADYGVPQRRHRLFVVAGPSEFAWPKPTHANPATLGLFSRLRRWVTVRDALGIKGSTPWLRTECLGAVAWPDTEPAPTLSGKANTYVHPSDPGGRRAGDRVGGSRPELLDRPSPTVSCKGGGPGGNPEKMQRASDALFLATGRRRLTPAECAALQTFPADYPWQGTQTAAYRQIGNAVPPLMAEHLARALAAMSARGAA